MKKRYFISFCVKEKTGAIGYGSTVTTTERKIKNVKDIETIEKSLAEKCDVGKVVILHLVKL